MTAISNIAKTFDPNNTNATLSAWQAWCNEIDLDRVWRAWVADLP